jgi:hypothetical protein
MGAPPGTTAGTPPLGDVVFRRNLVVGIRRVVVDTSSAEEAPDFGPDPRIT